MTKKTINEAFLEAQKKIGAAVKGSDNPFFRSKYADLGAVMEVVKKPLNDAGLSVSQELNVLTVGDKLINTLSTIVRDGAGDSISSSVVVPEIADIQKFGAAVTYLKRYTLQAMLFVPTEDDDGNSLVKAPKKAAPKPVATTSF